MKILAINTGSTSLKFAVFNDGFEILHSGLFLSEGHGYFSEINGIRRNITEGAFNNADEYIRSLLDTHPDAIGYRIVHGGSIFNKTTELTADIINKLEGLNDLAPLHNPKAIEVIRKFKKKFVNSRHFGIFDTAFHTTIPKKAYLYGIPIKFYNRSMIRKYGFHGISYSYINNKIKDLQLNVQKVIICHIGGGVSICAINEGVSIDTSMGFTPNEGAIMATRSGSIDMGIITYMIEHLDLNIEEVDRLLNHDSGLLGLSKITSDMRQLLKLREKGNKAATLAIDVFVYRLQQLIGKFAASLGGVDAIVFSAGIGEKSYTIRKLILDKLQFLGFILDKDANIKASSTKHSTRISTTNSRPAYVIHTDEEMQMAHECKILMEKGV